MVTPQSLNCDSAIPNQARMLLLQNLESLKNLPEAAAALLATWSAACSLSPQLKEKNARNSGVTTTYVEVKSVEIRHLVSGTWWTLGWRTPYSNVPGSASTAGRATSLVRIGFVFGTVGHRFTPPAMHGAWLATTNSTFGSLLPICICTF